VNMFVSCCNPIMDLCTEIFQLSFHGLCLFFLKIMPWWTAALPF
jgi:hypothetical protein